MGDWSKAQSARYLLHKLSVILSAHIKGLPQWSLHLCSRRGMHPEREGRDR